MILNWIQTLFRIIPSKILIKRIENYHTHYLGKCSDEKLFWGYLTSSFNKAGQIEKNYVVLHLFNKKGVYLKTKYYISDTSNNKSNDVLFVKLEEFVKEIEPVKFCNIKVQLFKVEIDNLIFGLIPDKKYYTIDLEPHSTISFTPPWNGYYDT